MLFPPCAPLGTVPREAHPAVGSLKLCCRWGPCGPGGTYHRRLASGPLRDFWSCPGRLPHALLAPRACWLSPGAIPPQPHAWPCPLVQPPLPSTSFLVLLLSGGELLGSRTSLPLSIYLWSSTQPGSWLSGILDYGAPGAQWPSVEWMGRGPCKQKHDAGSALSDL